MSRLETALLWALFASSLLVEVRLPFAGFSAANLATPLVALTLAWRRREAIPAALARHRVLLAALLALYVWTWVSAANGVEPRLSMRFAAKYTAHLVVFVSLLVFLHQRNGGGEAQPAAYVFLALLAAIGIAEHWFPQSSFFGFFRNTSAAHPRITSLMIWPNQFGVLMAIAIGLGATLVRAGKVAVGSFYLVLPVLILALALAGSRNGWLVFSTLLTILAAARVVTAKEVATIVGLFVVATITFRVPTAQAGLSHVPGLPLEDFFTSVREGSTVAGSSSPRDALVSRSVLWHAAAGEIRDHPVTGIGLEAFANTIGPRITGQHWINTHNLLLNVAVELGLVGLALFLVLLWTLARSGNPSDWPASIPLVGIGVGQMFDCFIYDHAFMALSAFFAAAYASRTRVAS